MLFTHLNVMHSYKQPVSGVVFYGCGGEERGPGFRLPGINMEE